MNKKKLNTQNDFGVESKKKDDSIARTNGECSEEQSNNGEYEFCWF